MQEEEKIETPNDDIFHYLCGDYYVKEDNYYFLLYNENEKKEKDKHSYYESKKFSIIADPGYDATFKCFFSEKPERLENFLNSVYFKDNGMKLTGLKYLVGEFNEIGKAHNWNNLRADICCKAKANITKNLLIDIEIQINWLEDLEYNLIENNSLLTNGDSNKESEKTKNKLKGNVIKEDNVDKEKLNKVYNDIIVIAFKIDKNNDDINSNKIELAQKDSYNNNVKTTLNGYTIFKIKIFKELDEIRRNNKVKLFGKYLSKDGSDWLKLIGLRSWAIKHEGSFGKYIFPNLKKNDKFSKNPILNEAIMDLLGEESKINLTFYSEIEKLMEEEYNRGKKDGIEEGIKKGIEKAINNVQKEGKLIMIYSIFALGQIDTLKNFPFKIKYKTDEVYTILNNNIKGQQLNQNLINNFIDCLKSLNCIEY